MNNIRVSDAATNYAYKAYIPIVLSHGAEIKDTYFNTQLFSKDEENMANLKNKQEQLKQELERLEEIESVLPQWCQ